MEKLYLGVDLHKRSCWVTVLAGGADVPFFGMSAPS
jgi:hypothetical protein